MSTATRHACCCCCCCCCCCYSFFAYRCRAMAGFTWLVCWWSTRHTPASGCDSSSSSMGGGSAPVLEAKAVSLLTSEARQATPPYKSLRRWPPRWSPCPSRGGHRRAPRSIEESTPRPGRRRCLPGGRSAAAPRQACEHLALELGALAHEGGPPVSSLLYSFVASDPRSTWLTLDDSTSTLFASDPDPPSCRLACDARLVMSSSELLRLLERRAGGAGIAKPSESVATGPSGVNSEEEMVVVTGPTRGERKKKEHHRPGVLLTEAYVV